VRIETMKRKRADEAEIRSFGSRGCGFDRRAVDSIVGWMAEIPVRLVTRIFRLDREKTVRSWYGRSLTGISALTLWVFALIQTLRALDLLGWWDSFLRSIGRH